MMGDNRDNSQDSRYWGFLPREYVKGKALFVYFSFGEGGSGLSGVAGQRAMEQDSVTRYTDRLMKTVLKLVIAVALLNAVVRGADSAWDYYQLKDVAQRALLFGSQSTSQQLHGQIMQRANELRIPLKPEDLSVRWRAGRRVADASYTAADPVPPQLPVSSPVFVQRRYSGSRARRLTTTTTHRSTATRRSH